MQRRDVDLAGVLAGQLDAVLDSRRFGVGIPHHVHERVLVLQRCAITVDLFIFVIDRRLALAKQCLAFDGKNSAG